jgi:dTDP-4-amino-4,6-dideoxygalactose transaminase
MDGIQGAILRVKLRHLDGWTETRRARAADYHMALAGAAVTPAEMPDCRHVYHVYAVRVANRDAVRAHLQAEGIQTGVHYPIPVHLQPAYRTLGYRVGDFPVAESAAGEVLSLPIYPELTREQVAAVATSVRRFEASGVAPVGSSSR